MILTLLLMLTLDDQHDRLMLLGIRVNGGYGSQAFNLMRRPVLLLAVRRAVRGAPAERAFGWRLPVAIWTLHEQTLFLKRGDTLRIYISSEFMTFTTKNSTKQIKRKLSNTTQKFKIKHRYAQSTKVNAHILALSGIPVCFMFTSGELSAVHLKHPPTSKINFKNEYNDVFNATFSRIIWFYNSSRYAKFCNIPIV